MAADEARHERVYVTLLKQVIEKDPVGGLEALHEVMSGAVSMPALTMTDGSDTRLFAHFAEVGQRIGVYTHRNYAENLTQLVETLGLPSLGGLPCEAHPSRDAICALPGIHRAYAEEGASRKARPVPFRWIFGRKA